MPLISRNHAPSLTETFTSLFPDSRQSPTPSQPSPSRRRAWTTADQIESQIRLRTIQQKIALRNQKREQLEHLPERTPTVKRRESLKRAGGTVLRGIARFFNVLFPVSILVDSLVYPSWSQKEQFDDDELHNARERLRHIGGQPIHIPVQSYALGIPIPKKSVRLDGMYLPAGNSHHQKTVIFCNPNAGCYEFSDEALEFYRYQLKCNVLLFNYRGVGESEGRPTTARTLKDMEAVFNYATGTLGISPKDLLLHGRSLGGAHAAKVGSKHPEVTVICDRAFPTLAKAASTMTGGGKRGSLIGNAAYAFTSNDLSTHALYQKTKGKKLCVSCHHDEMFENYKGPGGDVIHLNSKAKETHNKWSTTFKAKAFNTWVRENFLNA